MFGHKVIFLNPTFVGHGEVFKDLQENEYEFYLLDDIRDLKNVLREYQNSICIAYADETMEKRKLINLILSCAKDDTVNNSIFYILTSELSAKEKKALEPAKPCFEDVIKFNPKTLFLIQDIKQRLEDKNAKGRRQYVRVSCQDDKDAAALADVGGRVYKFKMSDISIVGSACSVDTKYASFFEKGTKISYVNFFLEGKQISVANVIVYAIFEKNGATQLVLLFKNPLPDEDKIFVHKYIQNKFRDAISTIVNTHPRDTDDYTKDFAEVKDE